LKRVVRDALGAFGLEISRATARADTTTAFSSLLHEAGVSVVLDVGAATGEFAGNLRRRGFEGRIVSFEPRREAFAELSRRAARDPRWTARNFAVGAATDEVAMNVAANRVSSSLLEMEQLHIDAAPRAAYVETEDVRLARLDDLVAEALAPSDIVALKLDVQGYEAAVLEGAVDTVGRSAALHVELSLAPVYKGQPDWRVLCDDLIDRGFVLYALQPVFSDPATGQTLQIDAVFRRA
jgi:FkbM family methyltransferase